MPTRSTVPTGRRAVQADSANCGACQQGGVWRVRGQHDDHAWQARASRPRLSQSMQTTRCSCMATGCLGGMNGVDASGAAVCVAAFVKVWRRSMARWQNVYMSWWHSAPDGSANMHRWHDDKTAWVACTARRPGLSNA
eukprot:141924-Chlamydomonas_euryale.AAC.6